MSKRRHYWWHALASIAFRVWQEREYAQFVLNRKEAGGPWLPSLYVSLRPGCFLPSYRYGPGAEKL